MAVLARSEGAIGALGELWERADPGHKAGMIKVSNYIVVDRSFATAPDPLRGFMVRMMVCVCDIVGEQ